MVVAAKHLGKAARTRDFDAVLEHLRKLNLLAATSDAALVQKVGRVHAATFSLFLWRYSLRRDPEHSRAFISEMASDALQILPHALAGFRKTTALLVRGVVESSLRHVYFSDHPVEFERANSSEWFIKIRELFDYAKSHPRLREAEERFDALSQLSNLYAELSKQVHGGAVATMDMRRALSEIRFDAEDFSNHEKRVRRCAGAVNFILSVVHKHRIRSFSAIHQQVILDTIPSAGRRTLAGL